MDIIASCCKLHFNPNVTNNPGKQTSTHKHTLRGVSFGFSTSSNTSKNYQEVARNNKSNKNDT